MNTRPTITEVPIERIGNKVCCQQGKIGCMCQPENHEGKGACGKIIDADGEQARNIRTEAFLVLEEIRAGPHSIRTVH
jgi:hypothetical protein